MKSSQDILKAQENINNLPECVIFDIDNTLSLISNREIYEYDKVKYDYPNPIIVEQLYFQKNNKKRIIIILSGRKSDCIDETIDWFDLNDIYFDKLYNCGKDNQSDVISKRDVYEKYIKDKYFVKLVYEDNKEVIDMFRNEYNLIVFQVN